MPYIRGLKTFFEFGDNFQIGWKRSLQKVITGHVPHHDEISRRKESR